MKKWLIKWGVKKFALDYINGILGNYKDNIQKALALIDKGLTVCEHVIEGLKDLRNKLADNKLTDAEADDIIAKVNLLVAGE